MLAFGSLLVAVALAAFLTVLLLGRRHGMHTRAKGPAPPEGAHPHPEDGAVRRRLESSGKRRAATARELATNTTARRRAPRDAGGTVAVSEEAIGVTRREFFNRSLLTIAGFVLADSGAAVLAFLWPSGATTGFGGRIKVAGLTKILAQVQANKAPFYVPAARTWLQRYPRNALPAAEKAYKPAVYAGMQRGVVALYQRCPHLGCRVPWCQTSQWFECPCHGSKYNAVGEKKAGPAPRGMDRFAIEFAGDDITINTETVILGPPIGTNTTGQDAEGPLCV